MDKLLHEGIRSLILSAKGEIMCEYGELFVVHWNRTEHTEYRISSVYEFAPDNHRCLYRTFFSEERIAEYVNDREKITKELNELKGKREMKIVYSPEWREKIASGKGVTVISEGENYIITKHIEVNEEHWSIEAPMHAKSGMANMYPWGTKITKEQAENFTEKPARTVSYYNKVRYGGK